MYLPVAIIFIPLECSFIYSVFLKIYFLLFYVSRLGTGPYEKNKQSVEFSNMFLQLY